MKEIDIDRELFAKISNGDESAFRQLFMKYFARLCAFVQTITRREEEVQDVVQKVFVNLWEKRKLIRITQSVIAYLMTSCRNEAFSHIRMSKTRDKYETQYVRDYREAEAYEMKVSSVDVGKLVNQAIEGLPDKCRRIYTMSKKEGLSYGEIADFLNISEKTVENQIGIALKKLREALKPHIALIHE